MSPANAYSPFFHIAIRSHRHKCLFQNSPSRSIQCKRCLVHIIGIIAQYTKSRRGVIGIMGSMVKRCSVRFNTSDSSGCIAYRSVSPFRQTLNSSESLGLILDHQCRIKSRQMQSVPSINQFIPIYIIRLTSFRQPTPILNQL